MAAELVLKNANVITMDTSQPVADFVAISGDKILLAGREKDLVSATSPNTKVIDCQGKTIVPGFNDAHCHLISLVRKLLSLDLSPAAGIKSIEDIKAAIKRKADNTPPGQWISGTGFNEFYLAEKRCPTRWDIDEVAPAYPVVLSHRSLHAGVLNSFALALAGITGETPEPPGSTICRDETGEPNGILLEMLGYVRDNVIPQLTVEELTRGFAIVNEQCLSYGITSIGEATVSNNLKRWQMYKRFKTNGTLKSRLYMIPGANSLREFQEAGLKQGAGDAQLRLGGMKIVLSHSSGHLKPSPSELKEMVLEAHRSGVQVAIHGIGENEVITAIEALEYAHSSLPESGRRHRIEHCTECPQDYVKRLAMLQAIVVTQPPFVYYSGERYLATVPARQLQYLYQIKSFLDNGVVVAGSSDTPIVPNNPLVGIHAAVNRRAASGQELLLRERVSASQALALYTTSAAYASFEEDIKGSISPGKLADIVVLSADPTKIPPEQIKDIKVEMTIIGGQVVWER